jgi:UDP-N-acetylmuramate dehydrogenase
LTVLSSSKYKEQLEKIVGSHAVQFDVFMSKYTSMKVGGIVAALVTIESEEALSSVLAFLSSNEIPMQIIGNGSNLIVSDKGYTGVLIRIAEAFAKYRFDGNQVTANSGILLSILAKRAQKNGLSGLEFASGIPGTLGGAVAMNAGAYQGEMSQVVLSAECMTFQGDKVILDQEGLNFGYRHSAIEDNRLIVLKAIIELHKEDEELILNRMKELNRIRAEKQPLQYPSAGSVFKRPVGYYAGQLIEECGLRGFRIGGAQVSEKHCGFIINNGSATASDVIELVRFIQRKVLDQKGVCLEPEIKLLEGDNRCKF